MGLFFCRCLLQHIIHMYRILISYISVRTFDFGGLRWKILVSQKEGMFHVLHPGGSLFTEASGETHSYGMNAKKAFLFGGNQALPRKEIRKSRIGLQSKSSWQLWLPIIIRPHEKNWIHLVSPIARSHIEHHHLSPIKNIVAVTIDSIKKRFFSTRSTIENQTFDLVLTQIFFWQF